MIQEAPTKWSKSYSNGNVLDKSPRPEIKFYGFKNLSLLRAYLLTKEIQFSPDFLRDVGDCLGLVGCHATSHCMHVEFLQTFIVTQIFRKDITAAKETEVCLS